MVDELKAGKWTTSQLLDLLAEELEARDDRITELERLRKNDDRIIRGQQDEVERLRALEKEDEPTPAFIAPCPFCKCEATEVRKIVGGYKTVCPNCLSAGPVSKTKQDAVSGWNFRHSN